MADKIWSTTLEGTKAAIVKQLPEVNNLPDRTAAAITAMLPGKGRAKLQASGYVHDDGKLTMNIIVSPVTD